MGCSVKDAQSMARASCHWHNKSCMKHVDVVEMVEEPDVECLDVG